MTYPNADLLASPEWLHDHKDDADLVIVDCPWDPAGYTRAHVPGALCRPGHSYVKGIDADGELTLYLPGEEQMIQLAADLRIGPDTTVVLYDEWGSIFAARLWWVLRYYGHDRAMILNGGWQGWVAAGLPVSYETSKPLADVPAFVPAPRPERLAKLDQLVEKHGTEWQVLDVRSDAEYDGTDNDGNARAGHVPGAAHVEWTRFLHNSEDAEAVRSFRSADEMRALLEKAGVTPHRHVVTHCQAAVRGAFGAFALELLGYKTPRLYDGSMAEWANRDDTPLE